MLEDLTYVSSFPTEEMLNSFTGHITLYEYQHGHIVIERLKSLV